MGQPLTQHWKVSPRIGLKGFSKERYNIFIDTM